MFHPPSRKAFADAPKWGADGMPHGTVNNPLAFVSIAPDGTVAMWCTGFGRPQGLAFDTNGTLFVVEALAGSSGVYRLPSEGPAELAEVGGRVDP